MAAWQKSLLRDSERSRSCDSFFNPSAAQTPRRPVSRIESPLTRQKLVRSGWSTRESSTLTPPQDAGPIMSASLAIAGKTRAFSGGAQGRQIIGTVQILLTHVNECSLNVGSFAVPGKGRRTVLNRTTRRCSHPTRRFADCHARLPHGCAGRSPTCCACRRTQTDPVQSTIVGNERQGDPVPRNAGWVVCLEEATSSRRETMNQIIWLVGLVVIVLFVAGYFGLR